MENWYRENILQADPHETKSRRLLDRPEGHEHRSEHLGSLSLMTSLATDGAEEPLQV